MLSAALVATRDCRPTQSDSSIYSYTSASGKTGDFQELFGKPNPRRNEPRPIPLITHTGRRSVIWEKVDEDLAVFHRDFHHRGMHLIADRAGKPLLAIPSNDVAHISRAGNVLRVFKGSGKLADYALEPMAGE